MTYAWPCSQTLPGCSLQTGNLLPPPKGSLRPSCPHILLQTCQGISPPPKSQFPISNSFPIPAGPHTQPDPVRAPRLCLPCSCLGLSPQTTAVLPRAPRQTPGWPPSPSHLPRSCTVFLQIPGPRPWNQAGLPVQSLPLLERRPEAPPLQCPQELCSLHIPAPWTPCYSLISLHASSFFLTARHTKHQFLL